MKKALNVEQILRIKHDVVDLPGIWKDVTGPICRHGVVFVWGNSGNGKTSVVLDLCRQLAEYGKVLYCPLEEGDSMSFQEALMRAGMAGCGNRFKVLIKTNVEELDVALSRQRSPEFVVIDSLQYIQMSYKRYLEFKKKHDNKLLIFVSHADGKQAAGRAARSVMYDADLKIWVEGYTAFSKGRFIGNTGKGVIWQEGADRYWGPDGPGKA